MTTYYEAEVKCANCGTESKQRALMSTNAFGSPDLDLRPPPMKRGTMDAWVQHCPHCGYCAATIESVEEGASAIVASTEYGAVLNRADLPKLARRFLASSFIVERVGGPEDAAHRIMCAAWVCDDARLDDRASELRRACAEKIPAFIETSRGTPGEQKATAVLVDVLRRCGDFDGALAAVDRCLAINGLEENIRKAMQFQQRLITAGDRSCHTIADAVQEVGDTSGTPAVRRSLLGRLFGRRE